MAKAKERMMKAWLSDRDLEDLGLGSAKTRQNLRSAGKEILPYYRFGRAIRYRVEDVMAYLDETKIDPRAE